MFWDDIRVVSRWQALAHSVFIACTYLIFPYNRISWPTLKDYAFKLQTVSASAKGSDDRKTVAKVHIDLAPFCTGQTDPKPVEKSLQLKPWGKLKVSIKACWIKDAKIDPEQMTEVSGPSMFGGDNSHYPEEEEQEYEQVEHG